MKGLPSRDLNFTPLVEVFPGQSQGTLAAKGKENFTAAALWVNIIGELRTLVPSAFSCTFSKTLFLTEACVLGLLCQWHIAKLCVREDESENESIFLNLIPVMS